MLIRSGTASHDAIDIYYEDLGDPDAPPVLLIMGLGAQLPMWPDGFCARLVGAGYRVVRFDHRDTGLSAKVHGQRAQGSLYRRIGRYMLGKPSPVPYTLIDMTRDVVALLDHLGIARAHVVGASLGGMIAQILAGSEPDRVASLGVIMSSTGKPLSAPPSWRVLKLRFDTPPADASLEDKLAYEVRNIAVFNGPNFLPSEEELRQRVRRLAERCTYPPGILRQFDAMLGTGSLLRFSKAITAPTVVLHGSHDPMVRPRNGRAVAATIPDARFVVVDGMGHDLPRPVWRPIVEILTENFALAD
ncbi:alpha/beta hydrolase [Mycobacterium intermedium]|uniref:Alpha/beta hydrolase n=1 Tax=Mycobacterium intermedium TaxID=28445 RepID=A0A1E3S9Y1_MYCIE|nr:alpha/beta fold hydrolase [Mycobacterium intermedium]MCV6962445.1 alpha/beta fold hydrolase [Mycobacterium intermedium]ODQ98958.1 hydrolase [Mycobacterium intermedium]OPE51233.1 alpha/beta hydrolase [Mycobacterium intermedium]ORB04835.1 alpha/beta hydrolase [Mycobacterium intermedium]